MIEINEGRPLTDGEIEFEVEANIWKRGCFINHLVNINSNLLRMDIIFQ